MIQIVPKFFEPKITKLKYGTVRFKKWKFCKLDILVVADLW